MKDKHKLMYMEIAECLAKASSAERLKVGSVIIKNNRIISCGYNAQPEHIDEPCEVRVYANGAGAWIDPEEFEEMFPREDGEGNRYGLKTSSTVRHSEKNALMGLVKGSESSVGAIMFCTASCCKLCAVDIVDSGIKEFYYRVDYRCSEGIEYLQKNGVKVYKI